MSPCHSIYWLCGYIQCYGQLWREKKRLRDDNLHRLTVPLYRIYLQNLVRAHSGDQREGEKDPDVHLYM